MPQNRNKLLFHVVIILVLVFLSSCGGSPGGETETVPEGNAPAPAGVIAKNSSYSSPIAISDDDALVVVTNTLNGTI